MKVPVAFHFWNEDSVSQWRPASFPLPEIEKAVKDDYAILQYEKPPTRRYGQYLAILNYETTRDAFNREIVSIRFAFVKNASVEPRLEKAIREKLSGAPRDAAFIRLCPWLNNIKTNISRPQPDAGELSKYVAMVLCALIVAAFIYNTLSRTKISVDRETASATPSSISASAKPAEKVQPMDVCSAAKNDNILLSCPRSYIALVCSGKSAPSYEEWRQKSDACRQARRNKFERGKDVFLESPAEPLATEILKTLFP